MRPGFTDEVFSIRSQQQFEALALQLFEYQAKHCEPYAAYLKAIGRSYSGISAASDIPFLPISFFRSHCVKSGRFEPELVFASSGTTSTRQSIHYVRHASLYRQSFIRAFEMFFGPPGRYAFVALLPGYSERPDSSLVYMVSTLMAQSSAVGQGFFLSNFNELASRLEANMKSGQSTLLIGVTHALLDFANQFRQPLHGIRVVETGGMKGRKKELTRHEVHETLKQAWQLDEVCSEYGMTELMSQAWALRDGLYQCPPWLQVSLRDINDPLSPALEGHTGVINVIDLANIHSCAFIATEDLGRKNSDGSFEVLGRLDYADLRGCSLLTA